MLPTLTRIKKLARRWLATTALTGLAAAGSAQAAPITEGTLPAPADFGNTFATRDSFAFPDVDDINGQLSPFADQDFIELTGFTPSTPYSINITATGGTIAAQVLTSSQGVLNSNLGLFPSDLFQGTVPADGVLVIGLSNVEGSGYTIQVTGTPIPEPSTLAGLGVAGAVAAGALMLRRRRQQDQSAQPKA